MLGKRQYIEMRAACSKRIMRLKEKDLLCAIEDKIGLPCNSWPVRHTEQMLSTHLRFSDRFGLTVFLLGNRCPPCLIVEWYLTRNMLKDQSAKDNIVEILYKHMTNQLEAFSTFTVNSQVEIPPSVKKSKWDVGEQVPPDDKRFSVVAPSFAFDYQHQWHWVDAMRQLNPNHSLLRQLG